MNLEEEINKSVPYKSIQNRQKQSYDNSSDENDLDMGFPTQSNIFVYNILKDKESLGKIRLILEGTSQVQYYLYSYLTVFEELVILLHFASHQNDQFMKKIKCLSDQLNRNEDNLITKIQDMSYFQRFTQQNVNSLIISLNNDLDQTLISRIKWKEQQYSTSSNNKIINKQRIQYILEIQPNILRSNKKEQPSCIKENKRVNSKYTNNEDKRISLQNEKKMNNQQQEEKYKPLNQQQTLSNINPFKRSGINNYFDSDSNENADEEDNNEEMRVSNKQIQQNDQYKNKTNNQRNSQQSKIIRNKNKFIEEADEESSENEDYEEDYEDENNNNQNKKRNSLNALLTETIQFEDYEQEDIEEPDLYEKEESQFFANPNTDFLQKNSNLMFYNGMVNAVKYSKCLQNIQQNQQLSLKQFLFSNK